MALKTFNLDAQVYEEFSSHCKKHGISMSKKIENFIKQEMEQIQGRKRKKDDLSLFNLDIEKDTRPKMPSIEKEKNNLNVDDHPMGKYC